MELHPPLHFSVVAIKKGAFGSLLTMVANFTYIFVSFLKSFFCTWSYWIWIIFKQIYLTHWWDPKRIRVNLKVIKKWPPPHNPDLQNWSFTIRCSLVSYPGHPLLLWGVLSHFRGYSEHIQRPGGYFWLEFCSILNEQLISKLIILSN